MIVVKGIGLIFWLLVIPFCIGLIPMRWIPEKKRNVGVAFVSGYLIMLPLCWLVTVPCILLVKYRSFRVMSRCFMVVVLAATVFGVALAIWAYRQNKWVSLKPVLRWKQRSWEEKLGWLFFFVLLGLQLYKSLTLASFDGDDAEYVAQSLVTQQSETMYLIKPYTGGTTSLDIRHSLAVLPIWIAYIGKMTGIHTTILAHSILPFVLIPLTYIVFYELGKHLLKTKTEYLPAFMGLMALLQIFGNVSIYTNETFFLTRTWQGKAVAASFVIPATLWLLLWIFDKEEGEACKKGENIGLWALLWCTNMTAGVCTSMVVFLNACMIAAVAFWMMLAEKKFGVLVKAGIVCVPNAAYMLLYLFLHV